MNIPREKLEQWRSALQSAAQHDVSECAAALSSIEAELEQPQQPVHLTNALAEASKARLPLSIPDVHAAIREAGGIVHSDGNIFFTRAEQFLAAAVVCGECAECGGTGKDGAADGFPCFPCNGTGKNLGVDHATGQCLSDCLHPMACSGLDKCVRTVGERMAFEAYMKQDKLGTRPTPDGGGSYAVTEVRWAWEAWQARAAITGGGAVEAASGPAKQNKTEPASSPSQPQGEQSTAPMELVRYCFECGSIGPVRAGFRDCCPDGSHAREVPRVIAEQARRGFAALYLSEQSTAPESPQAAAQSNVLESPHMQIAGLPFAEARKRILELPLAPLRGMAVSLLIQNELMRKHAAPSAQSTALEPARWESRVWMDGCGGEPVGWSAWETVKARNPNMDTVADRVAEFRNLIAAGCRYELRALFATPEAAMALPGEAREARRWIERWHGSGPDRGWWVWETNHGNPVAYVGEGEHSERLTSILVEKHNAVVDAAIARIDAITGTGRKGEA